MSRQFNQTASPYNGIIQGIETTIYGQDGLAHISGDSTQLGIWTTRVNRALDMAYALIFDSDGRWQFDDSNHSDYPTITTNLVDGQRSYAFVDDENGNLILSIHAVYVLDETGGRFELLSPVDETKEFDFYDGVNVEGNPTRYGKKGNAVFLAPIPDSNITNGLKIEIDREGSYFDTTDTTKKPGLAGLFHDYLVVRPAFDYALDNNLDIAAGLQIRVQEMEQNIINHYARREQDARQQFTMRKINHI